MTAARPFDRPTLEAALRRLGERARADRRVVELAIYGGSAMVLTLDNRRATRDVDAVFERDKDYVRALATEIAAEFGWERDWLNDGVKGFLSAADAQSKRLFRTYPSEQAPGLRVFVPTAEYLFAMKCMAMRIDEDGRSGDLADIRRLARELKIDAAETALDLVAAYYPAASIPPKTRFGIEELFGP